MSSADVLVVGAGPSGITLALALAQNGISVRIIEKLAQMPDSQRGTGSQPRTMELYKFLGVLDDILDGGRSLVQIKQHDGEGNYLKTVSLTTGDTSPTPTNPFRQPFCVGQEVVGRIMREHLKKHGVDVEFSSEIISLQDQEKHVEAEIKKADGNIETAGFKYIVGADGARGFIRKAIGLLFLGETRDTAQWVIGDLEVRGMDKEYMNMYGLGSGNMVLFVPTKRALMENVFYAVVNGPKLDVAKTLEDPEILFNFIRDVTKKPELEFGEIKNLSSYRPNNTRVVNTFGKGHVFVTGDAAHVHSPTGGQGLNSGIMDSVNLAWKLALVVKNLAPASLLDTYTEERLPVIKDMLSRCDVLLRKALSHDDPDGTFARPPVFHMLGVNYCFSSIVLDEFHRIEDVKGLAASAYEVDDILRAGARAPDAPKLIVVSESNTHETRIFDILRTSSHTILIFPDTVIPTIMTTLDKYQQGLVYSVVILPQGPSIPVYDGISSDLIVQDEGGYAHEAYGVEAGQTRVVIIRPDGWVGAIVRGVEGVEKYFSMVLTT